MKKMLASLVIVGLVLLSPVMSMAQDSTVVNSPVSVVAAFGASFISSPVDSLRSTGFSKATVFLYSLTPNISVGATVGSLDFNATNITASDLEQYGVVGIYHDRFAVDSKLGWFVKAKFGVDQLNGGPFDFSSLVGLGGFWNFSPRFGAILGIDPTIIDYKTKTWGATVYAGLETNLR